MLILLSNDDGVWAPGIAAARAALESVGEGWTVAPDREQSASSHSLTLQRPLRIHPIAERVFSVDGTPTDCVLVAVNHILGRRPDLVVSGENAGQNMGEDVIYSGTVAAAMEGTVLGIPAMAVSKMITDRQHSDYTAAARVAADLARRFADWPLPAGSLLNVNVPDLPFDDIKGVKVTRTGTRVYRDVVVEKIDPRGRPYYWVGGAPEFSGGEDTDWFAVDAGYVSATPLQLDMTDHRSLDTVRQWASRKP